MLTQSGCGCTTAGGEESGAAWLAAALAVGLGLEGRRRQRRSSAPRSQRWETKS
jgi:MYXO-CTERM domain-containing protein